MCWDFLYKNKQIFFTIPHNIVFCFSNEVVDDNGDDDDDDDDGVECFEHFESSILSILE